MLFFGISSDVAAKIKVLKALVKKFSLAEDVDLAQVARDCHPRMTGADLYAVCSGAMVAALRELIDTSNPTRTEDPKAITVQARHFAESLQSVVPSVSEQELKYYQVLHSKFQQMDNKK